MAAPMVSRVQKLQLTYSRLLCARNGALSTKSSNRSASSGDGRTDNPGNEVKADESKLPKVGMSRDGSTLICWHPEVPHPYKHTQPISHDKAEFQVGECASSHVLKDQVLHQYMTRYRPDGPNIQELANITYTTKHQWYPKPEKKFRKRNPPKDREGI